MQIKSKNLTVETGTKFTAALFYVTDSNSHNLLTRECVIELYLICLHRTTSDKCDKCATLQEVSVAKEKKVKANRKQFDDSKIPKTLQKLINSYQQNLFTGKIGKLKDTKIKLHINDKVPSIVQAEHRIPFALRKKIEQNKTKNRTKKIVQKQIEHLEQQDIIEDITSEATPWLSQLVIVPKSN